MAFKVANGVSAECEFSDYDERAGHKQFEPDLTTRQIGCSQSQSLFLVPTRAVFTSSPLKLHAFSGYFSDK